MYARPGGGLYRVVVVLALLLGVVALHSLDLGRSAPASLAAGAEPASLAAGAETDPGSVLSVLSGNGGSHAGVVPAPAEQHGQGDPGGDAHHGWIGMCLAILGSVLVLAAVALLATRWCRPVTGGQLERRGSWVAAASLPPPRPSIHVLCVMRT